MDGRLSHDEKVSELKRLDLWLPTREDPLPKCGNSVAKKATKKVQGSANTSQAIGNSTSKGKSTSKNSNSLTSQKLWGKKLRN